MSMIKLKDLLIEARIYGSSGGSTEYTFTADEKESLKNMTPNQQRTLMTKKLHQARREKGLCIHGNPASYCEVCLQKFRDKRNILFKNRNSCSRCPNPPLPGKKLCQKCTDELQARRDKALEQGICIRCHKEPAYTIPETGEKLQVCRGCADKKMERERLRKKDQKNWKNYGKNVVSSIRARKIANLGIQQESKEI